MFKISGSLNKNNNPSWPSKIGQLIALQKENSNFIYIGRVEEHIVHSVTNNVATCTILLLNPINDDDNILTLYPSFAWKYIDTVKLKHIINNIQSNFDKSIILQRYHDMLKSEGPEYVADIGEAVYRDPSIEKDNMCGVTDDFHDTSLLNEKGELQMENLFKEKQVNSAIFSINEKFMPTPENIQKLLLTKLKANELISDEESKIIVNKTVAIKNMIENKSDEENEGTKIINWIISNMMNIHNNNSSFFSSLFGSSNVNIFNDLKMSIFNGYLHIVRKGINPNDVITTKLVPQLRYFKWQYGIPIDYDTLKYLLFQNQTQQNIESDVLEQKEAERILSQEYLICMQPEPKYQMWVLKRLLMCYYADNELQYNIRKIKVLINQWRSRSDRKFNRKFGILPSIVIYPRYGKDSARLVLQKISDYFLLYQNTGWQCSTPSYFTKVNNLIWYTNGAIDLKLYFRKIKQAYNRSVKSNIFRDKYSSIKGSENLILQQELVNDIIKLK
jgi:hypothetical protein